MSRVMLITGASMGIGAAIAKAAAEQGFSVCVNYHASAASADEVVAQCQSLGVAACAIQADVAQKSQVKALFQQCLQQLGPVSVLVNNAGIVGAASTVEALDETVLKRTFEVNVFGAFYCAQEAIHQMKENDQGGVIINISSVAAVLGSPNEYVHYASSKAALDTFTIGLSKELGPFGIRVNSIQAGTTQTTIHERSGNPDRPEMVARLAPLGRVATPEEIAEAAVWLASDKCGYTTGAILKISGGL